MHKQKWCFLLLISQKLILLNKAEDPRWPDIMQHIPQLGSHCISALLYVLLKHSFFMNDLNFWNAYNHPGSIKASFGTILVTHC